MASKNVSVTFSAQIGELIDGVKGAKSAIESLGTSVNAAASGFKELAAIAGISLSIDGIKDFAESMAQLGAKIETAHEILGLSTTDVQKYGFVAKATGVDTDTFVQTIGRLQQNLERAQSGIGPTALALKALGLSAKELASLPIDQQILKLSDAFAKYADGGKKAALANELVRGGAENLLPAFDKGSAGIKKLTEAAIEAGTVMTSQTVESLGKLELKGITLKASLTALGGTLIADSTGLSTFSDYLTNAASKMTALASTGELGEFVAKVMSAAWERLGRDVALVANLVGDFFTKAHFSDIAADYAAGMAEIEAKDKAYGADLNVMIDNAVAGYKKLLAAQHVDTRPLPPSSAQPNTSAISAAMSAAQEQIKLTDEVYQQAVEKLSSEVKLHQITYSQETQALLTALDARHAAELAALAKEQQIGGLSASQYQKITNEKLQVDQKYAQDRQKVMDQAQQKEVNDWKSAVGPIESAFNSQISSMLAGTETFGQAMKKVFADMVTDIIKELLDLAIEEAIVFAVTGSFGSVGSMGTGVVGGIGKVLGFDVGTNYVTQSGLAIIHEGEQIVPAQGSGPYSGDGGGGIGSGGGTGPMVQFHFNGPVIGNQAWINSMMPQLTRAMNGYQNINPSAA